MLAQAVRAPVIFDANGAGFEGSPATGALWAAAAALAAGVVVAAGAGKAAAAAAALPPSLPRRLMDDHLQQHKNMLMTIVRCNVCLDGCLVDGNRQSWTASA